MEFYFDDVYYIYIENKYKSVIKLQRDYEWYATTIEGVEFNLGTLFSNMDIDEVISSLSKSFERVELIDESEIDDYMED